MEEMLRPIFLSGFAIIVIIIAIIFKYVTFAIVMEVAKPFQKGNPYKIDDAVAVFYVFVTYTSILLFKNGIFVQSIVIISYFIWGFCLIIKNQMTSTTVLIFIITIAAVSLVSISVLPNYQDTGITDIILFKKILITEAILAFILCIGIPIILNIENKPLFFIKSILVTIVVYLIICLLIVIAYFYKIHNS